MAFIKLDTLRRAGHVSRMEESDPGKKVLCTKPGENGVRGGRPKLRRCDEAEVIIAWGGC
jgi:hypothetical protein